MHDNLPEVVISKSISIANFVKAITTKEYFSGKAVAYLREDLLKFAEEPNIDENNYWPPTFEDLNAWKKPASIIYFFTGLQERHRHVTPEKTTCLTDSSEADLIYGISNGRFITAKHFSLSMGLSMGLQTPVLISLIQILPKPRHANSLPINIDPRASLPNFSATDKDFQDSSRITVKYFIWLLLRQTYGINAYTIANDQIIPSLPGMYIAL